MNNEELNGLGEQPEVATEQVAKNRKTWKRKPWVYLSEHNAIVKRYVVLLCIAVTIAAAEFVFIVISMVTR